MFSLYHCRCVCLRDLLHCSRNLLFCSTFVQGFRVSGHSWESRALGICTVFQTTEDERYFAFAHTPWVRVAYCPASLWSKAPGPLLMDLCEAGEGSQVCSTSCSDCFWVVQSSTWTQSSRPPKMNVIPRRALFGCLLLWYSFKLPAGLLFCFLLLASWIYQLV